MRKIRDASHGSVVCPAEGALKMVTRTTIVRKETRQLIGIAEQGQQLQLSSRQRVGGVSSSITRKVDGESSVVSNS